MGSGITTPGSGITTRGIGISSVLWNQGSKFSTFWQSEIKILNDVFEVRDQNFGQKYRISNEKNIPRYDPVIIFFIALLSVVGEKEESSNTVNVRTRDNKVHGEKTIDQVLEKFAFLAKERIKDSEDEF